MGAKNIAKNVGVGVGKGVVGVGKGVKYVSVSIYNRTFLIAQIIGLSLTTIGIVIVAIMSQQKFGLTNLKPLFTMITGVVLALVGIIMIGVSYGIRWKRRMIDRVTEIEETLALMSQYVLPADVLAKLNGEEEDTEEKEAEEASK